MFLVKLCMIDLMESLHATKRMKQNNYSVTRKKKSLYDGLRVLQSPIILLDMTPDLYKTPLSILLNRFCVAGNQSGLQ